MIETFLPEQKVGERLQSALARLMQDLQSGGADILAVASGDGSELLVATVDLDNVAKAQTSLPWWRDRRPELYGALGTAA